MAITLEQANDPRYSNWANTPDLLRIKPGIKEIDPGAAEVLHPGSGLPQQMKEDNDEILRERVGGKSVGLLRLSWVRDRCRGKIRIPKNRSWITDNYNTFMAENGLSETELMAMDEESRYKRFNDSKFTAAQEAILSHYFEHFHGKPMYIRSSGRFEYRKGSAYYGKFDSEFLANSHSFEEDFELFKTKIKKVFASTWCDKAIAYRDHKQIKHSLDWMSINFMEGVGHERTIAGRRVFCPEVSGVLDYDRYRPTLFHSDNIGNNTLTMDGWCIFETNQARPGEFNTGAIYNPGIYDRVQAFDMDTSRMVEYVVFHSDRKQQEKYLMQLPDVGERIVLNSTDESAKEIKRMIKRRNQVIRAGLNYLTKPEDTPLGKIDHVFNAAVKHLESPQRMEYSIDFEHVLRIDEKTSASDVTQMFKKLGLLKDAEITHLEKGPVDGIYALRASDGVTYNTYAWTEGFSNSQYLIVKSGESEDAVAILPIEREAGRIDVFDAVPYVYQFNLSATHLEKTQIPIDMAPKGTNLMQVSDTNDLLGCGEYTGPLVWVQPADRTDFQKMVRWAEDAFPGGYSLAVSSATTSESAYDNAGLFDLITSFGLGHESDLVAAVTRKEVHLIGGEKGERKIKYPSIRGFIIYPHGSFTSVGHHMEGLIDSNLLAFIAEEGPEGRQDRFRTVQDAQDIKGKIHVLNGNARIAVDGLGRKALLEAV